MLVNNIELVPGYYNTQSFVTKDMYGNVVIEKDYVLERALKCTGAKQVSEFVWRVE